MAHLSIVFLIKEVAENKNVCKKHSRQFCYMLKISMIYIENACSRGEYRKFS